MFEHFALSLKDNAENANYEKLIKITKDSKQDLISNGGYDEIVIEDFYDCFLGAIEKLKNVG